MSLLNKGSWEQPAGNWDVSEEMLTQRQAAGNTRCWQRILATDYIARFKLRLVEGHGEQSEGKFIFSSADTSEADRVDFIYRELFGVCRISVANQQFPSQIVHLVPDADYEIEIQVKRNYLTVAVNGLTVYGNVQTGRRSDGKVGFGTWNGVCNFLDCRIDPYRETKCFVIMQFDQHRDFLYEYVVKKALDSHPDILFDYTRADESLRAGRISVEICERIRLADLVIADISGRNRNVYYELGYAHALKIPVVHLIERPQCGDLDLPFDIQDFRCHGYPFTKDGFEELEEKLPEILSTALEPEDLAE